MGTMRYPTIDGDESKVDMVQTKAMVDFAIASGVNYFDTAYMYHRGTAENVIGKCLKNYPRESFFLADKFPGFQDENFTRISDIFEEQLKKCQVEYFDFYLLHNVSKPSIDNFLKPQVREYFLEQKANGRIRHFGFSCHAEYDDFCRFLDAYGDIMEFCQIQLNWFDWNYQDARLKVAKLNEMDIPIWVMEPQRGGKIIQYLEPYADKLKAARPNETVPGWSFRFLQSIPGVTMILSGMSNIEQVKQNIATFETDDPLNDEERQLLLDIAEELIAKKTVPCTACQYCTSYCPLELNIPDFIKIYNDTQLNGRSMAGLRIKENLPAEKLPSACLSCGACASVCPQSIQIPDIMKFLTEKYC